MWFASKGVSLAKQYLKERENLDMQNIKLKGKIFAILLAFVMIFTGLGIGSWGIENAYAAAQTITTYVTISNEGELVVKNKPVELTGKETYNIDDALRQAHEKFYVGGADAGYASYTDEKYGLSLSELWGDESKAFGYYVNDESASGLGNSVKNGDSVTAYVYKDKSGYSDSYSYFDKKSVSVAENEEITLNLKYQTGYDENWKPIFDNLSGAAITINDSTTEYKTDENGNVTLNNLTAGAYIISATKAGVTLVPPVCTVVVDTQETINIRESNVSITVPEDAALYVGIKGTKHFVSFTEQVATAITSENEGKTKTYYYKIAANKDFNYRVSGTDYITYASIGKSPKATATEQLNISITKEQLQPEDKNSKTVDKNVSSNKGYNVADIFLNINPQNYLKLSVGEKHQIVNIRNWQTVNNTSTNYFIEPDYNYKILDIDSNGNIVDDGSSVIGVSKEGLITAKGQGTAIVLVSYDAINVESAVGGPFFGAIWPENTGVFVVSVESGASNINTNMTINEEKNASADKVAGTALDSELDVIYYLKSIKSADGKTTTKDNPKGEYTFTPTFAESISVMVANPIVNTNGLSYSAFAEVSQNVNNSYTVPLTEGRNIVKISTASSTEYQVITAKGVNVTINNITNPGQALYKGDKFNIVYDTIFHPANKLAGIYNMAAGIVYSDVDGFEGKLVGGNSSQYTFASASSAQTLSNEVTWGQKGWSYGVTLGNSLQIPSDYVGKTLNLSGGAIYIGGYGSPYGDHRKITLEEGAAPNLNAKIKVATFGSLPNIELDIAEVATASEISSVEISKAPTKVSYYDGDIFDASGLELTVKYKDNSVRKVTAGYSVSDTVLKAEDTSVNITFGKKTVSQPITVAAIILTKIEITTAPTKTAYTAGEYFNPSGMVVKATYSNGDTSNISDYTWNTSSPLTEGQNTIDITFGGKTVSQTISVAAKAPESNEITVYFTLMGDSEHGETGTAHTLKAGNLTTWIAKTAIKVPTGSNALTVMEKALSMKGYAFVNTGNYISEVKGLAEMDNGPLSGWMYTYNGSHGNLGVQQQTVKDGDAIVFHYTDDYTKEQGSEIWAPVAPAEENKVSVSTNAPATVKGDTASAAITASDVDKLITDAGTKKATEITLNVTNTGTAKDVAIELPKASLTDVVSKTDASLVVATPQGDITLDQKTMSEIASQAKGSLIIIEIKKVDNTDDALTDKIGDNASVIDVTVKSGDTVIKSFNGNKITLTIELDDKLKDKTLTGIRINENGIIEKLGGKKITKDGKTYFALETDQLSEYAVAEESVVDIAIAAQAKAEKIKAGVKATTIKTFKAKATKGKVVLTFTKSKGYKVDGYYIYKSTKKTTGFKYIGKTAKNKFTNKKSLTKGKTYYYKVKGYRVVDGVKVFTKTKTIKVVAK